MSSRRDNGHQAAAKGKQPVRTPQHRPVQQSQTTTQAKTSSTVVTGFDGEPVQVIETEEHVTKKTVWTRILTGATNAAKPALKQTGKALKSAVPQPRKTDKDNLGSNLSYYRKTFFLLDKQTQFDLYMAGLAPRMTKLEAQRFDSQIPTRRVCRRFKKVPVMYATQEPPKEQAASPRNLVKGAQDAKTHAAVANSISSNNTTKNSNKNHETRMDRKGKGKMTKVGASSDDPDALPAHPTPEAFNRISYRVQIRSRPASSSAGMQQLQQLQQRPQQRHRQQQQQQQQHRTQPQPQQQSHRLHPQVGTFQATGHCGSVQPHGQGQGPQATVRAQAPERRSFGRRMAGQTVATRTEATANVFSASDGGF
ncbi:hypothetical protein L209DRAFT_739503 [Thermothelomyces heterothallicus CBS 203.75]